MNKNIGKIDKIIRIVIALLISTLYITGFVSGALGFILLAIGGILLVTALVDFCPIYSILKIKSTKSDSVDQKRNKPHT